MVPVFDGHNDFLMRVWQDPGRREALWRGDEGGGGGAGHLDLPRMQRGGFAGGLFAIYVPSAGGDAGVNLDALMNDPPYDLPLPPAVPLGSAQPAALAMAGHLMALERMAPENFALCRTVAGIEAAMAAGRIAGVMHMEGAEAIDEGCDALHVFHAMGLRSLGPVWSRPTVFGHGVPFRFPGSPDTGPGLTAAGKRLVRACNRLGILVDLSHLNLRGMADVALISDAPLVASHSNAHAVTPSTRNLTDAQLDMIRESGGLVGLNFATVFLRPDGRLDPATGWEPVLRHLDHLIGRLGEDHVGLGSDFDGATVPDVIGDAGGLQGLVGAMRVHGFGEALVGKLAWRNWLAVLRRTWGA
jgi:membrane dipeptidase